MNGQGYVSQCWSKWSLCMVVIQVYPVLFPNARFMGPERENHLFFFQSVLAYAFLNIPVPWMVALIVSIMFLVKRIVSPNLDKVKGGQHAQQLPCVF